MKIIVFTDLDGTLLDFDTYSFHDALPTIAVLKSLEIPIIPNTSKTLYETVEIMSKLRLKNPFVVENGGGIFIPKDYPLRIKNGENFNDYILIKLGKDYKILRGFFEGFKKEFNLIGFGDMDDEEIMKLTGLEVEKVKLMRKRMFSEPFVGDIENIRKFSEICIKNGYKILKGGRFYHLVWGEQDKGRAVKILINLYKDTFKDDLRSIGLGDSENDEDMLKAVDIPIIIPNPKFGYANINVENAIRVKCMGSKGWAEGIKRVLGLMYI